MRDRWDAKNGWTDDGRPPLLRRGRALAVVLPVVLLLAGIAAVSSPSSASAEVKPPAWCAVWNALQPLSGGPATDAPLPDGSLVTADLVTVKGSDCQAADSGVDLRHATISTPGTPEHGRSAAGVAQVTPPNSFGPGSFVVSNVALGGVDLSLRLGYDPYFGFYTYWHALGSVLLTINDTVVPLIFVGDVRDSNNYTLSVGTPAGGVTIPGFAPDAFSFAGSMTNAGGIVNVTLSADAPTILFQNLTLTGTHLKLTAGTGQASHLEIGGTAVVGPSSVSIALVVDLNPDGSLKTGGGTATVDLRGTLPDGKPAHLAGTATVHVDATTATLGLQATGELGDAVILGSNLSVSLSGNDASLDGSFDLQFPGGDTTFTGSLSYDGTKAQIASLSGSASATYAGTLADSSSFSVDGHVSVALDGGGAFTTVLTGAGKVGPWNAANANFTLSGTSTSASLTGGIDLTVGGTALGFHGSVAIAAGTVTGLDLSASVSNVTIGDATVTSGTFHLLRNGSGGLELDLNGGLRVGGTTLSGSFRVTIAADGSLTGIVGSGSVTVDGTSADGPTHITGNADITFSGGHATIALTGSGTVAGLPVAGARLTLSSDGSTISGSLAANATVASGSVAVTGQLTIASGVVSSLSLAGTLSGPLAAQNLVLAGNLSLAETAGAELAVTLSGSVTVAGVPSLSANFALGLGAGGAVTSVKGTAGLALTGRTPDGVTSTLSGSVAVDVGQGNVKLGFTGSGNLGGYNVVGISGTVTGSGSAATLAFSAQAQLGSFGNLTATGSATFGGGNLSALQLSAAVSSSYAASGQSSPTKVTGSLTIGVVGGAVTASVAGTITNGTSTLANADFRVGGGVAALTASVNIPGRLTANVTGTFYYGAAAELAGRKIANKAGAQVSATTGDFVLSAPSVVYTPGSGWGFNVSFTTSRVGADAWLTVSGGLRLSDDAANNTLTFAGFLDNSGNALLSASGKLSLGGNVFTTFSATLAATTTAANVTGNGCLSGPSSLSACLTFQFANKAGVLDYYSLSGTGTFALWGFLYNNVGFSLSKASGGVLTGLNVHYSASIPLLFFSLTLVWVNFDIYFNPNGTCNHVKDRGHSLIVGGLVSLFIAGAC